MSNGIGRLISRLSHDDVIIRLEPIVVAFTTGEPPIKGGWAGFMTTPDELKSVFYTFKDAHVRAKSTGSFSDIAERNSLRPVFNATFTDFMDYVDLATRKDPSLPYRAGMDYFRKPAAAKTPVTRTALTAPDKFSAKQGPEKGMVICSALSVPGARGFEIMLTDGDALDESTWKHHLVYGGASKMIVTGLDPGKMYTFRVRAIRSNEWGPWSHYITMLVV
ncbi:MAG TPA: fibronectin type III domain-containing protein [Geomonas sp.]|nr:fibronectin type III domain-containing protein [Geomonas sp.]